MKKKNLLTLILLVYPLHCFAQTDDANEREVVVTATRTEADKKEVASSVTVITAQDIEERKISTVVDALKEVPGVDVVQSGGAGGNAAVFIRGANSEHTLVLIDGVEANNPISNNRSFNFADLSVDNIERIEIVRGPQGTLYGSDALGGVIQIITKKGEGAPKPYISVEGGAYTTFIEKAGVSGGTKTVNYALAASRLDTDGISAADSRLGNSEKDAQRSTGVSTRLGVTPNENLEFTHTLKYDYARTDLDNSAGVGGDDPNRLLNNETLFTRAEAKAKLLDKKLTSTVGVSYSDQELRDNNNPDVDHPIDVLRSQFDGSQLKFDWVNIYKPIDWLSLLGGIETEREEGNSTFRSVSSFGDFTDDFRGRSARTNGYFAQGIIGDGGPLSLTLGGRIDDHSKFGTKDTWRVAPMYFMEATGTKFSGTLGTGFKAPSLFELFSSFGREDLRPEKSLGWDLGVEQEFLKNDLTFGATYFRNNFDQLISFDPTTFIFENIASVTTKGVELTAGYKLMKSIDLGAAYTYTDATDDTTGEALLRRARNKYLLNVTVKPCDKLYVRADLRIIGSRWDNDFSGATPERVKLGSYATVDLSGGYDITKNVQLFTRVENLFDREYEDVLGYGTRGFGVYGGVKVSL
jgi:vitamin B12 transporter